LARPGAAPLVDVDYEGGYFGEILASAALARGIGIA
jgi:hypothetical protein